MAGNSPASDAERNQLPKRTGQHCDWVHDLLEKLREVVCKQSNSNRADG